MYSETPAKAPYLDWALDRWKIGVILALFVGLALASVAAPPSTESVVLPSETLLPANAEAAAPTAVPSESQSTRGNGSRTLLVPGPTRPADTLRLPLTLASLGPNAVVPPSTLNVLFGTAAAGSSVKVFDQVMARTNRADLSPGSTEEKVLGLATTSADGLWQVALAEPLVTGQHVITLHELGPQGELTAVSAPVVVTVLALGEQGPLALATPIIRSPALGMRLTPGVVEFTGTGLPGVVVRLHLNNSFVAESLVTTQDDWRIVPEQALTPGIYTARVTALNPQGDVLAESAPVIFVVEEPAQSSLPLTLPAPSLPLTISGLAFGDRRRTSLVVNGTATPHASIAAWLEGHPVRAANAALDGHWMLYLENMLGFDEDVSVEVRSNFGERVRTDHQLQRPGLIGLPERPLLVSPRAGEVLTNSRPLLVGVAPPAMDVAILVNRQVVARVRADPEGQWHFQLVDPLPRGAVALAAGYSADLLPEQQAAPIVVMVMPHQKTLATRPPLSLAENPPKKLYYPVHAGP
ncbi:MAG: hypothetical protein IT328_09405 [Caldilineaceae bacterium]|nr:hypothetical protein [Caldilineaceae bacterium]